MLLMGCARTASVSRDALNAIKPIRSCMDPPNIPGANATQRDVAEFIIRQEYAYLDCRNNLRAVDRFLSTLESE